MILIDKDALVAEIKRRSDNLWELLPDVSRVERGDVSIVEANNSGRYTELESFESFIDTLEVKEVDFKPIDDNFERDAVQFCFDNGLNTTPIIARTIAKHFFELGLSVNNPITAADRGMAEEIIINLKRVEKDYRINLTREIEWLRNKVKKGEKL